MKARFPVLLAAALLGAGCSDGAGPEAGRSDDELQFVRFPPGAPALETMQASFWAVAGQDRRLEIRHAPEEPGEDGEDFLEFRVPADALLRRPDGSRFAPGDSVQITVTISGDGRYLFDFQPSGLFFDSRRPARLKISYRANDDDLDGDGSVDDDDHDLDARLRMWKQEQPGTPWLPVGTVRVKDMDEIEGTISSFTGFCIAG